MALSSDTPSTARDRHLLSKMTRGEESAFREFYGRHSQTALGLAFRILRDRALAEDAVQEAFLTAWRQAGSYRAEGAKPVSWLLMFVHRRAVDQVRRQERHSADPLEFDEINEPTEEDASVTRMPTQAWIRAGLDRLSPQQREVLELAYFAGLTQTEIADRYGVSQMQVSRWIAAAVRRLRDRLPVS